MRKLTVKAEKFPVYLRPDGIDYNALFEQIAEHYAEKKVRRIYDKNGKPNRSLIVRLLVQDKAKRLNRKARKETEDG
jgi:hypothetical protein